MLKSLIGKAIRVVDDAGVETVLTLAFVAQFAAHALPLHMVGDVRTPVVPDESVILTLETGTVVQMPAGPNAGRAPRAAVARHWKGVARPTAVSAPKAARSAGAAAARVRRPEPVDDGHDADEADQLRPAQSSVRITIIGPDGQPRTKVVRLAGSRDGMTAPARRPHD